MSKLVSVIIPAYNVGNYIEETIISVQNQTYPHWELLVVNDGSTDATEEKIEKMVLTDSRIHLFNQANGGSSRARNTGLENAKGDYIAFLDGDDMWKPTFLEELLAAKENAGLAMAYCGYTHLYSHGLQRGFGHSYANGDILLAAIKDQCQIHIGCTLVDKAIYDIHNLRFTDGCLIGQDTELILKLISITKVVSLPKELMLYRIRKGSAIRSKWQWQKHIHAILGARRARSAILERHLGKPDREEISAAFEQRIAFRWLKFVWRMIKNGCYNDSIELLNNPIYSEEMKLLDYNKISLINALKFKIVNTRNIRLWKKINTLGFL